MIQPEIDSVSVPKDKYIKSKLAAFYVRSKKRWILVDNLFNLKTAGYFYILPLVGNFAWQVLHSGASGVNILPHEVNLVRDYTVFKVQTVGEYLTYKAHGRW